MRHRRKTRRSGWHPRYWTSWALVGTLWLIGFLPLPVSRGLGVLVGLAMFATNAKRRRIGRTNLRLAFPERSDRERRLLLRRHFFVSGQAYLDVGFLAVASERRFRRAIHVNGAEILARVAGPNRRLILIAPHCVGMNVGGLVYAGSYKGISMFKPQRNPAANWLLAKIRLRYRSDLVPREAGLRPIVRAIKNGVGFYYLPDEDLGPEQSIFAPFFGVPRATVPILGRLARMTDAQVVPIFTRLLPNGRGYEVIYREPLANFPTGDDVQDATAMNDAFEAGIREMPEQYMWTLKIFRSRPDGGPSPYA